MINLFYKKLHMKRRDFVKNISIAGAGISLFNPSPLFARSAETKVRLGIIGTGLRGQNHLWNALQRSDVDVVAICDVDEVSLQSARELVTKSGRPMPKILSLIHISEPTRR